MKVSSNFKILGIGIFVVFFVSCLFYKDVKPIDLQGVEINSVNKKVHSTRSSVHLHLKDGGLVVMNNGFDVYSNNDTLYLNAIGGANHYNYLRSESKRIEHVNYNEVEFIEVNVKEIDALSALFTAPAYLFTGAVLAYAIFGSCPTVYSMDCEKAYLEAETFSYSISKRFEMEDVDKLEFASIQDGILTMQLRNEALETHYLNTFKILSAVHDKEKSIFPTEPNNILEWKKELIQVGSFIPIDIIKDKYGHDISSTLNHEDNIYHETSQYSLDNISEDPDKMDWVELEMELPENQDNIYLALKMRSTLLNTVLLYDMFLANQNFAAIDWISQKTNKMYYAYQFAKWYRKNFGMHIEIWEDGAFQEVRQIGDSGPITWSKLAFEIPVKSGGKKKIRLRYIADNWHIDWVGLSLSGSKDVDFKVHDINDFTSNTNNSEVLNNLIKDDDDYLVTYPGQSYEFKFHIDDVQQEKEKSLFVQSKGFYIEWLRNDWLIPDRHESFREELVLNDDLLESLYIEWECQKATMEDYFFETMVPIATKETE